jgi:hypothetical protein
MVYVFIGLHYTKSLTDCRIVTRSGDTSRRMYITYSHVHHLQIRHSCNLSPFLLKQGSTVWISTRGNDCSEILLSPPNKCWESRSMLKLRKSAFYHFFFKPSTVLSPLLLNHCSVTLKFMESKFCNLVKNAKEKRGSLSVAAGTLESGRAKVPTPRLVVTIECDVPQCFPCLLFEYCHKKTSFLNTVSPRLVSWMCSFKPWRYVKRREADPFLPQETWEIRRLRSSLFLHPHNMNYNINNMKVIGNISIFLAKIHEIMNFSNVYLKFYDILYSPMAKIEARERWWRPGLVNIKHLFARVTIFRPFS